MIKHAYTDPRPIPRTIKEEHHDDIKLPDNISWNSKIETNVKEIGEKSKGYKIMHIQSSRKISRKHNLLMYSGILLGPLAGLLSGIGAILKIGAMEFPIAATCAGFVSGIVVAVSKFGKFEEKISHHKLAASKYTSLESNVRRQLDLGRTDRVNAGKYLEYVGSSFDELFLASPFVARHIYEDYVKIAQKHGLVVPDEYGLTINVDKSYQKNKFNEMKNVSAIGVNDSPPISREETIVSIEEDTIQSPEFNYRRASITDEISKGKTEEKGSLRDYASPDSRYRRTSLNDETFKGNTEQKRDGKFTHFPELNKFSDGRMEYEMQRMMGLK